MSTKPEALNVNSPYIKLIVYAFVIGGAWARLEYKMNESSGQILKKIDEHIIADGFEKRALQLTINQLSERLDKAEEVVLGNIQKEFIRPSETRLESKKRKQF